MKISATLALFASLAVPVAADPLPTWPHPDVLPTVAGFQVASPTEDFDDCAGHAQLVELIVSVDTPYDGDISVTVFDVCARARVAPTALLRSGTTRLSYCLNMATPYQVGFDDDENNFVFDEASDTWGLYLHHPVNGEDDTPFVSGTLDQRVSEVFTVQGYEVTVDDPGHQQGIFGAELPGFDPRVTCNTFVGSDPHFKMLGGHTFDFHGQCDLNMMTAPGFSDGLGLDIHVRTKSRYQYSYIESAAVKIGDDVLEVGSYGQVIFNGVENVQFPLTIGGLFPVEQTRSDKKNHIFEIDLGDEKIVLKTFKDMVGVSAPNQVKTYGKGYSGMFGQIAEAGKQMVDRTGTKFINDPIEYGMEWQVRDTDPKLFQNKDYFPQWPEKCVMPSISTEERRRLGELKISEEQAKRACEVAGRTRDMDNCIYDVIATGDLEMVEAGAF